METEVTCVLSKKDRLQLEDKRKLGKLYIDKLYHYGVISQEQRDSLDTYWISISYNPQQSKVEFRLKKDSDSGIPADKNLHYSSINKSVSRWRKHFSYVRYPGRMSNNTIVVVDQIPCDGEYRLGQHLITLTV